MRVFINGKRKESNVSGIAGNGSSISFTSSDTISFYSGGINSLNISSASITFEQLSASSTLALDASKNAISIQNLDTSATANFSDLYLSGLTASKALTLDSANKTVSNYDMDQSVATSSSVTFQEVNVEKAGDCYVNIFANTNNGSSFLNLKGKDQGAAYPNGGVRFFYASSTLTAYIYSRREGETNSGTLEFGVMHSGNTTIPMIMDKYGNINLAELTASRVLTLDGSKNIVTDYQLDQDVASTSSPQFGSATFTGVIRATTSLYRRYYHLEVGSFNPGASGATRVNPGANSLGGWQLDAAGEILYFETDIHADWDAASNLELEVYFEKNTAAGAGTSGDTADLKLVSYYKGTGETATKTQTVEVATTVGEDAQYTLYKVTFDIDYTSGPVEAGDKFSFSLNLETDSSECDNIIITNASFNYETNHIGIESGDT